MIRSKSDIVNRPVRTARTFVHHYDSTQYCNTETICFQYSPSFRPTSHLRCGQVEVRGWYTQKIERQGYNVAMTAYCFDTLPGCDRQIDGQTDQHILTITKTALYNALCSNNLVLAALWWHNSVMLMALHL